MPDFFLDLPVFSYLPWLLLNLVQPNRSYGDERNATQGCCHKKPLPVTKQAQHKLKKLQPRLQLF
jgi:hypothetical protein